jgi:hypothetical protein
LREGEKKEERGAELTSLNKSKQDEILLRMVEIMNREKWRDRR